MQKQKDFVIFPITMYATEDGKKGFKDLPPAWQEFKTSQYVEDGKDYAIVCDKIIVVDLDIKDDNKDSLLFLNYFKASETYSVVTGTGGRHIYYWDNDKLKKKNGSGNIFIMNGKKMHIDLRGGSKGFVVGAGSLHPVTKQLYVGNDKEILDMPEELVEALNNVHINENFEPVYTKNNTFIYPVQRTSPGNNQLADKLAILNPEHYNFYGKWLDIGFIIYNLGGSVEDFINFSMRIPNYNNESGQAECKIKWRSFTGKKEEKLGWNKLNEYCIEDDKESFKKICEKYKLNAVITTEMFPRSYYEDLYRNAKDDNEKLEITKKFMKYFILNNSSGKACVFYIKEEAGNLFWFEATLSELDKSFKCKGLFNQEFAVIADSIISDPTEPTLFNKNNRNYLNVFCKPAYTRESLITWKRDDKIEEKVHNWLEYHMLNVICRGVHKDYVWLCNWISRCLFDPSFRPDCAPVIFGGSGAGKSTLIEKIFMKFLGQAAVTKTRGSLSEKGDLAILEGKMFCLFDELKVKNDEELSILKVLITGKTIIIRNCYKNERVVSNFMKCIICSNHFRNIISGKGDERRFVYFNADLSLTNDEGYFGIYDEDSLYFSSFFLRFNDDIVFRNYKTSINTINSELKLSKLDRFIKEYLIPNYNQYVTVYKNTHYIVPSELYEIYKFHFDKIRQDAFNNHLTSKKYCDKIVRISIDNIRKTRATIQPRERIIELFKLFNKVDPVDYDECICMGAKAIINCESCGFLCELCRSGCSCENITKIE